MKYKSFAEEVVSSHCCYCFFLRFVACRYCVRAGKKTELLSQGRVGRRGALIWIGEVGVSVREIHEG